MTTSQFRQNLNAQSEAKISDIITMNAFNEYIIKTKWISSELHWKLLFFLTCQIEIQ